MKKKLFYLSILLLFTHFTQAQIISFTDPQMLPSLLKYNTGVDKNKDGFISIQEANKWKEFTIQSIDTNNKISDFSGIEYFNTITDIGISYCNIDSTQMNKIKPEFVSNFYYTNNISKTSILNLTKYWNCNELDIRYDKDIKTVIFPDKSPVSKVWFDYTNIKELIGFENQSMYAKINHCDSITTLNLPSSISLDISDSKNLVHLNNQSNVSLIVGNQNGLVINGVNLTINRYENAGTTLVTVCVADTNDFNQNHNIDWIQSRSWVGQVQYNYIQYDRIIQGCDNINAISDKIETNNIEFYPNPTKDVLNVSVNIQSNNYSIQIANSQGVSVYSSKLNNSNTQINLSNLGSSGLYFVKIIDTNNNVVDIRKIALE